jgi:hypothetical protein
MAMAAKPLKMGKLKKAPGGEGGKKGDAKMKVLP